MKAGLRCLVTLGVLLALAVAAGAEGTAPPRIEAVRITTPPVLDGDLGDPCWQEATKITDLREMNTNGPPKEATTFWLGYDDRYLYWAAYAKDSRPAEIRADQKKRGGNIWRDDLVELDLDTYHSHKEAYYFTFTPRGTQYEWVPSGSVDKTQWQGDWDVATRIVADGWTGEARIPFKILRYPSGATTFGVMMARRLARADEWYTWPANGDWDYEKAADWTGLKLPRPRPQIAAMAHAVSEWTDGSLQLDLGLDAKCVMPSGMVGQVTVNPDFEDVAQQVEGIDFTYTERQLSDARPFFVEGRGIYPPSSVFYSRRLENVDVGLKWFGRIGQHRVAFLDAWDTGARRTDVANWCWDYRPYSSASVLAVLDDHEGEFNSTFGAGISRGEKVGRRGSKSVSVNGYSATVPGGTGTRQRWNAGGGYTSGGGHSNFWANYEHVDDGFSPSVGYFPESGVEGWSFSASRSDNYRTGALQYRYLGAGLYLRDKVTGGTYDHTSSVSGNWSFRSKWGLYASYNNTRRPPYDDHVTGLSTWWNSGDLYRGGGAGHTFGKREGGDYRYWNLYQGFKLSQRLALQAGASWMSLDAPDDHTSLRLLTLSGNYDLDPEHTVSMRLVDSVGGFNAYLAYSQKMRRGTDLYVILGDPNADETADRMAVKTVWSF